MELSVLPGRMDHAIWWKCWNFEFWKQKDKKTKRQKDKIKIYFILFVNYWQEIKRLSFETYLFDCVFVVVVVVVIWNVFVWLCFCCCCCCFVVVAVIWNVSVWLCFCCCCCCCHLKCICLTVLLLLLLLQFWLIIFVPLKS